MAHESPIPSEGTSAGSAIPDKLYFRIGEVARLCAVPAYVLRFWESEFPQLRPGKGGTGQRLFRRRDVEMALRIKTLLYHEGYTIPGARQLLRTEARPKESQLQLTSGAPRSPQAQHQLQQLHASLKDLLDMLSRPPAGVRPQPEPPRRQRHLRAIDRGSDTLFDFGRIGNDTPHDTEKGKTP